jgi:hypothetical protein
MSRTKKQPGPFCVWTRDSDPDGGESWDTACDHKHQFMDGGPSENEHAYCPYCGRGLVARKESR